MHQPLSKVVVNQCTGTRRKRELLSKVTIGAIAGIDKIGVGEEITLEARALDAEPGGHLRVGDDGEEGVAIRQACGRQPVGDIPYSPRIQVAFQALSVKARRPANRLKKCRFQRFELGITDFTRREVFHMPFKHFGVIDEHIEEQLLSVPASPGWWSPCGQARIRCSREPSPWSEWQRCSLLWGGHL